MRIEEMDFGNPITKPILEYKSDGNTPTIRNHYVFPSGVEGVYYRNHKYRNFFSTEILTDHGEFLLGLEHVQSHNNVEYLKEKTRQYAQHVGKEPFVNAVKKLRDNNGWLKNIYMLGLRKLGELELADECDKIHEKQWEERNEKDRLRREENEKRRAEEKAKRESEIENAIQKAESVILNGGTLENDIVHGQSIFIRLMEKHGIKPALRTRGWIINTLASVEFKEDGGMGYRYRSSQNGKGSQKVWDYLFELKDAIENEKENAA